MEKIWFEDPKTLFTKENYSKFYPSKDMTFPQQLNTFVRLSIYFSIVVFVLKKDSNIFFVVIFVCIFTFFLYKIDTENKITEKLYLDKNNLRVNSKKEVCQIPTKDNPFMNVLISDYATNPTRKKACHDKALTKKYFDSKLYRDADDIFHKQASDRQCVTNPVTEIPNDSVAYAKWLYGVKEATCKEEGFSCYKNLYNSIQT